MSKLFDPDFLDTYVPSKEDSTELFKSRMAEHRARNQTAQQGVKLDRLQVNHKKKTAFRVTSLGVEPVPFNEAMQKISDGTAIEF